MDKKDQILEELKIQSSWLRIIAIHAIKDVIKEEIKSEQDRKIYELSDGQKSTREIAKEVGSSHMRVFDRWNKWASIGLVTEDNKYKGRYKKVFELRDLGIK